MASAIDTDKNDLETSVRPCSCVSSNMLPGFGADWGSQAAVKPQDRIVPVVVETQQEQSEQFVKDVVRIGSQKKGSILYYPNSKPK